MKILHFAFALMYLIGTAALASPKTFVIDDPGGRNVVEFTSEAPIENVIGTTHQVTGAVTFDPENLENPAATSVKVDLRTLDTGIEKRNEHMRNEEYLHTKKYPFTEFEMEGEVNSDAKKIKPGEKVDVTFSGKLTLHGVTREIEVTGKASYFKEDSNLAEMGYPGDMFNFNGGFKLNLDDYNIERPQFLIMKLSNEIEIDISFTATTGRKQSK